MMIKKKQEKYIHNLADLALLSQGLLKGNALTSFINPQCGADGRRAEKPDH